MKDIENIEDWYRDELNNYNVEPDTSTWNSLSEELDVTSPLTDENISEWYKKEATKLEERPDYTVWEKLSTKLDTTTVWDKLATSLNKYDQYIFWRNLVFKGSAIFILFLGSYFAFEKYSNNNELAANQSNEPSKIENKNNAFSELKNNKTSTYEAAFSNTINYKNNLVNSNSTSSKSNKFKTQAKTSTTESKIAPITHEAPKEKIEKTVNDVRKNISPSKKRGRSKYNDSYASMDKIEEYYSSIYKQKLNELKTADERTINTDIDRHQLTEKDVSHLYSDGDFLVKKDNNKIVFNSKRFSSYFIYGLYARRIYIGFNAGLKKQGMITRVKKNSPLAEYKQNDFLDFGSNFGGTIGFIVSDNFNLEANVNLNSTAGFKRAFNAEGVSYEENLNLNYTSISILAKKMNNKSTFDNKVYSTNLIGGVYASYLRSTVSDANGVSKNIDDFNKTDFGLVLGIEQDRYITKTFVITPGIRYNQGITNNANENSLFESSRNFSFEFNLGIKYIFLKKGK